MGRRISPPKQPWRVIKNGSVEVVIYREARGFRAVWYFAGVRERKFFVDDAEVVSFAKKQAASLGNAQPKNEAHIEAELRYVAELRERLGETPLHVAVDFYLAQNKRQRLVPARAKDLLPLFLAVKREDGNSPSYADALGKYLSPFVEAFPGPIHERSATEIDHWIRGHTRSLHSRWHFLSYLKTFFKWARDIQKALPGGATEADAVITPEPRSKPIEIYTPEEMRLYLQFAADIEEVAVLVLGGFAGLRSSEITGEETSHGPLPVESILFEAAAVKVIQKMKHESQFRYAPLPANALSWLAPLRGKSGAAVRGRPVFRVMAEIARRINEAHAGDADWKPLAPKRNGLRRSHISYRMAMIKNAQVVAEECNTSPTKIKSNYQHPELEGVAHAYYSISRL